MNKLASIFSRKPPGSFEELLAPHMDHLYRLAYRFTGDRVDAEDLVQELLYRLYPRVAKLKKVEALRPWLSRALYNRFIDEVRRRRHDPLEGADTDQTLASRAGFDTPETDADSGQLQHRLVAALETLGPEERALVTLHDVEGYTLSELENILDAPIGTLKSRLHRTRRKLRSTLKREPFAQDLRVEG